MILITSYSQV